MKNNAKLLLISIVSSFLLACGGSSGGNTTRDVPDNANPTLADLVGAWAYSYDDGDEYILFINDNGQLNDYDYLGDSFDDIEDCYIFIGGLTITDLGGGVFSISGFSFTFNFTISNNELLGFDLFGDPTFTASTIQESNINECVI